MQCGGMKKAAKMKTGGVKKMAKGGSTTNKLNNARGFAKAQTGGDNPSKMIYGIPNAGMTGPNRNSQTETMKKGGAKKSTAKKPLMKTGGPVKKLRKSQDGTTMIGTPSLKDVGVKNIYQGPLNKSDYENLNKLYPINNETPRIEPTVTAPSVLQKDKSIKGPKARMSQSAGNQYMQNRVANYLRSGRTLDSDSELGTFAPDEKDLYSIEGKKRGGAKKAMMKKGGAVKKMAKGGTKFPDLTGDGKVTKADVLKGRGVIKKTGGTPKAKFGMSVKVQRSPKAGKVTAVGRGYAAVGKREPGRIIKKTITKKK